MSLVRKLMVVLLVLGFPGVAYAQRPKPACVPNPNLSGPPFTDACPLPASALNNLFPATLTPEVFITDKLTGALTSDLGTLQVASQPALSANAIYQMTTSASVNTYDATRSIVNEPAGTTTTGVTALAGYIVNNAAQGGGVNTANAIALFGVAVDGANNAQSWGGNVICTDNTSQGVGAGPGRACHGFEIDANINATTTTGQGLLLAGASSAQPPLNTGFPAIEILPLGVGSGVKWTSAIVSTQGATEQGFNFGAIAASGTNVAGVPNYLWYFNGSGVNHNWEVIVDGSQNLDILNTESPALTTQTNKQFEIFAQLSLASNGTGANAPSNSLNFLFVNGSSAASDYTLSVDNNGILQIGGLQNTGVGKVNSAYPYSYAGNVGATCSGSPSGSFATFGGIVTHC